MSERGLTPKQERFVGEYLKDLNATQAAIRAGYSAKTAEWIGPQLLGKTHVSEAIAAKMAERSQRTQIDADWLLLRLAEYADADLSDLHTQDGALKPVSEWPAAWRKGLVAGVEVFEEFAGSGPDRELIGHTRKVKLADRIKVLELIGRHIDVGAFREKVEVSGKDGGPVRLEVGAMSTDALRELVEARRRAGQ